MAVTERDDRVQPHVPETRGAEDTDGDGGIGEPMVLGRTVLI